VSPATDRLFIAVLRYDSMGDYDEHEIEDYLKSRRLKAVKLPPPAPPPEETELRQN